MWTHNWHVRLSLCHCRWTLHYYWICYIALLFLLYIYISDHTSKYGNRWLFLIAVKSRTDNPLNRKCIKRKTIPVFDCIPDISVFYFPSDLWLRERPTWVEARTSATWTRAWLRLLLALTIKIRMELTFQILWNRLSIKFQTEAAT